MSIIPPSKKSGFTLIEIVIVLSIASLIMVLVFVAVSGASVARRNDQRRSDARRVLAAVESNPDLVDLSCFTLASPCSGVLVTDKIKQALAQTTFQDPTQVRNIDSDELNLNPGTKDYVVVFRRTTASGLAPYIEIRRNGKCENTNGRVNFVDSLGSNAVYIGLEPFKTQDNGTGTGKFQIYGTAYCINT
jgi:prepilin-type N-terminal cleavage/methylation domain-containing protein